MILIDTNSIHHSLTALKKELDYQGFIDYLEYTYKDHAIVVYVNENAKSFIKYLVKIPGIKLNSKEPLRKKISEKQRVHYLSFAVDIAIECCKDSRDLVIVSTDIELLPVVKQWKITLYGLGIPKLLRDQTTWFDIPQDFLKGKE